MYTTSFVDVALGDLLMRVQTLKHEGVRFVQMCAEKDNEDNLYLLYTFYDETDDEAINLAVPVTTEDEVPSIQELYFAAFSYENETHDLFGIHFVNMKLDFGGNFFNLAAESPMTILSPEQKAARDKAAKVKAAQAAKAAKAVREAAEQKSAEKALTETPAEADAAAEKVLHSSGAAMQDQSGEGMDERTAKMVAKLATMPPEKAAKLRENLAAKGIVVPDVPAAGDDAVEPAAQPVAAKHSEQQGCSECQSSEANPAAESKSGAAEPSADTTQKEGE